MAQTYIFCVICMQMQRALDNNNNQTKKTKTIMAEVMENVSHTEKYASNAKANAGLTTGKL